MRGILLLNVSLSLSGAFHSYNRCIYAPTLIINFRETVSELKAEIKGLNRLNQGLRGGGGGKPTLTVDGDISNRSGKKPTDQFRLSDRKVPPAPPIAEQENYEEVIFWTKKEWREHDDKLRNRNGRAPTYGFLCDEYGDNLTEACIEEFKDTAKLLWNQLYYWRIDPSTWSKRNPDAEEFFSNTMRTKFPEFRYCEGNWKLQEFATLRFPDWNRYQREGKKPLSRLYFYV